MKRETYECMCSNEKPKQDLLAMYFQSGDLGWMLCSFSDPRWSQCDRHVCKECVTLIKECAK